MNSTEPMVVTVAGLQGQTREGQAERSSRQTRDRRNTNGQRGRVRGRAGEQRQSPKSIKTHQVESDGVRGKFKSLPGEISGVRAREKSAKAVVARRLRESGEEPRAAESTNWRKYLEKEPRGLRKERGAATTATTPPKAGKEKRCNRSDLLGAKFEAIILRDVPESKFEGSTAGCGKPHVRWCGRGGGRNPATPTRCVPGMGLNY